MLSSRDNSYSHSRKYSKIFMNICDVYGRNFFKFYYLYCNCTVTRHDSRDHRNWVIELVTFESDRILDVYRL